MKVTAFPNAANLLQAAKTASNDYDLAGGRIDSNLIDNG